MIGVFDMDNLVFLTYLFQGYKFEFVRDVLLITNIEHHRKYEVSFNHYDTDFPFTIVLIEKNKV